MLLCALYLAGDLVSSTAATLGRDDTLTGRTDIWARVLSMAEHPIVGGGYSSFWLGERLLTLWNEYSWHPIEAHNGYLEIYLDLGIIGLTLLAGVIVSAYASIRAAITSQVEYAALRLSLLVASILYNVTESAFRPGLLMYFLFLLTVFRLPSASNTPPVELP